MPVLVMLSKGSSSDHDGNNRAISITIAIAAMNPSGLNFI